MPTIRSRVDWGFGLVMLSFCPTMRLSSVDFPTFGFPATVTIPALGITEDSLKCWLTGAVRSSSHHKRKGRSGNPERPFPRDAADGLLSRVLSDGVPSAL